MRQPNEQGKRANGERWDALLLTVCVALPACLAMAHAANAPDAAHDEAMVRAVGLGWTGAWRALDAPWSALFAWLPLGTRAMRAALASAMACGAGGGVVYVLARAIVARVAEEARVGRIVAAIAALAATLSPAWQMEASAPAGGCLGAVLALAPLAIVVGGDARGDASGDAQGDPNGAARLLLAALASGVAFSYEPLVGLAAIVSVKTWWFASRDERVPWSPALVVRAAVAFVVGCAPFAIALGRRGSELATNATTFALAAGERGESVPGMPAAFARDEVGTLSCIAVVAGVVLAFLAPRARGTALALGAIVIAAVVAMICGAPAGPTRYGAPVLAAMGAAYAIAAVAMQAIVRVVEEARVPFAHASASMILVLEMALPARAADDASARADLRSAGASRAWNDAAFSALPAGAALLVGNPRVETRLLSARAAGEMRADVGLVPLFDLAGHVAMRELARDAKLQPLWHDAALVGAPQEWSLSSLASWRPLVAPYDAAWDRALARHFVPVGLFARFEPEPRGASDRRRALDDFSATRDAFAHAIDADPELRALTASLLRARVITVAATSERDVVGHAIDDLRPFSPRDPVAGEVVRRMAATRGAIDVKDLSP